MIESATMGQDKWSPIFGPRFPTGDKSICFSFCVELYEGYANNLR
jgi:hypothetical protein